MAGTSSWNGYRRIDAAVRGQWPDRRPVMLHNFMHAAREAGLTMRQYYTSAANAARAHAEAAERYDLDGVLLDIDTAVLAEALGVPVDYPEDMPARTSGARLTSLAQVKDLPPPDVAASGRIQVALEAAKRLKDHFGDELYIRGNCDQAPYSLAGLMRGSEHWMMDLVLTPDDCYPLLDYCLEACLQFIDLMAAQGVHMVSNGDSPAGPDMVSPAMFRTFAKPYERKLCARAHELGLPYVMHICGKTNRILEDFADMEFDGIELDFKTDVNLIHDTLAGRATLFGTLDPTGVLTAGSPDLVEAKAQELLLLYRDTPRLVMNAGCAIPPTAPAENLHRLVTVTHAAPVGPG